MAFSKSALLTHTTPDEPGKHGPRNHKFTMTTRNELSIRNNDGHLIDIASPADTGITPSPATGRDDAPSQTGREIHTEWLRELTSAPRSTAVLNDLIGRTPTLWYLGERPANILRPRTRRAGVKALLHTVRAVAIGPYHRGDRGLAFDDEAKLPFLQYLRDQCGLDVEQYVAALGAARGRFRDEFAEGDDDAGVWDLLRDEEKFVKMLLLDSSFLLVFGLMFGRAVARGHGAAASVTWEHLVLHSALAQHADEIRLDLLVLENQVPFAAVKLLAASCRRLRLRSVEELVLGCFDGICPRRVAGSLPRETTETRFCHILHLFHWSRVPENKYRVHSMPLKLHEPGPERLIPCARELQRAAVWFRKPSLDTEGTRRDGDLDMEFWSAAASPVALMIIPSFHILPYTAALLHNMVAFEKHLHWAHGVCVTVHLARMEGLVRCPQDAALLRQRCVLGSVKCNDEEVVDFFRDIGAEAVGMLMPDEYGEMLSAVAQHRRRRARNWCGNFILHFLPSPWVAFSLAAVSALMIVPVIVQTIYTILAYQSINTR